MSDEHHSGLLYGLEQRIPPLPAFFSALQHVLAGLVGLVPNCAASILLTQLYAAGQLSFAGAVAGLSTSAGVGLAVLFRANKSVKQNVFIVGLLYVLGVCAGMVAGLFG